jgi:hypothetical protein
MVLDAVMSSVLSEFARDLRSPYLSRRRNGKRVSRRNRYDKLRDQLRACYDAGRRAGYEAGYSKGVQDS